MGTRTYVEAFDDIDGTTEEVSTIPFALEGVTYEIDLNKANIDGLREALSVYVKHARRTGGKKIPIKTTIGPSNREIRDWARSNGYEVPERGVLPLEIREAFEAAHS